MTRIFSTPRLGLLMLAAASLAACSGSGEAETPDAQSAAPAQAAQEPAPDALRPEGQQQPPASPRDTAQTQIADARIYVDYGRPSMRGRQIMGGLVPYGQVWRTGANEATTLVTQRDLRIGGTTVPAGTYTLYTLPGESAWQLIINKQTGQWGTEYDQAQDLARIPMQVGRTPLPVEQFTIALEPGGGNVLNLVLTWENTRASVPMEIVHPGAA
jgi:predicted small lipoprotein YifL